jgi:hypothetical protein
MTDNLQETEITAPLEPETLEQTGLAESTVENLILKVLYFRGDMYGQDLSAAIALKFSVIQDIVEMLKLRHDVQVKRSLGMGNVGAVLALTEAGRARAREILEANQYAGPAPVPLEQYTTVVRNQRPRDGWLTKEALSKAFRGMVITERLLSQVGPAVSSGNSLLLYGKPGDGKTFLIESLNNLDSQPIFLPSALECQGNIIQLYDPIYHQRLDEEQPSVLKVAVERSYDKRWIKCKRPFIVSGGELSLDMLDLRYNHTSKIYEAPFQLKAVNGTYLVDDFGRQRATPAEVLNRWIVPMERRVDYLSFITGGKMTVPFETFLVFSTNLNPADLGDEAFLRRIQYKMLLRGPSELEFIRIFERFTSSKGVACQSDMVNRFIDKHYRRTGKVFRRCHPRDVLTHALNLMRFEKMPVRLTDGILDRAFESCFLQEQEEGPASEIPIAAAPPAIVKDAVDPCPVYWEEQFEEMDDTTFGGLVLAASLRDAGIGSHRDGEATRLYSEAENARVLLKIHGRVFREWLEMSPDEQSRDLQRFLKMLDGDAPDFHRRDWLETLAPPDAKPEEVQVFVRDVAAIHRLVNPGSASETTVLSIDQRPIQPPSTVSTVPLT